MSSPGPFSAALAAARNGSLTAAHPNENAVRDDLTPRGYARRRRRRPRRDVETMDYAAMMRRMVRAYGRRVADADVEDLAELIALRGELDTVIAQTVTASRARHARSWADIGRAAGITRQSAHERWGAQTAGAPRARAR